MNSSSDKRRASAGKSARPETKHLISSWSNRTSLLVALIAASVSLGSAVANYWFTERVRTDIAAQTVALQRQSVAMDGARLSLQSKVADLEEVKTKIMERDSGANRAALAPHIAKLLNDLRPNVRTTCLFERPTNESIRVNCTFESGSVSKVTVTPTAISAKDALTGEPILEWSSGFEGLDSNAILSGNSGRNSYSATLSPSARKLRNVALTVSFTARTESAAVNMARRLTEGFISEAELEDVSTQGYTQTVVGDFAR